MNLNPANNYLILRQQLDDIRNGTNGQVVLTWVQAEALRVTLRKPPIPAAVLGEAYVITYLRDWVNGHGVAVRQTRTLLNHLTMRVVGKDGRRQLPAPLCKVLNRPKLKVEVKWIACYLQGVHPPPGGVDNLGRPLECSHRCINQTPNGKLVELYGEECIEGGCLCWEAKGPNQERGNAFCARNCSHHAQCGSSICACNALHAPTCV